jgi:hypothetical protein
MGKPLTIPQALARVRRLEASIRMAKEYLESGKHADSVAFRAIFKPKLKDGKELPPHKDWVKNFYLKQMERRLVQAEKVLWQLERQNNPPSAH